jgi:DHA1 family inner membrane transport protein
MSTVQRSLAPPVDQPKSSAAALYTLSLGYFAMGTASLAVVGLSVPMGKDLHVDPASIGLLVTVFALVFAVAAPLAPIVLSRLDRKWTMVVGLSVLTVGAIISAVTPSYKVVVIARVIAALGAATFAPLASAAGSLIVAKERRQRALATVFAGMTIASVLGVPLATFLSGGLGWRPALLGVAGLCGVALVGVLLLVPRLSTGVRPTVSAYREVLGSRGAVATVGTTLLFMAAQFVVYGIAGVFLTQRFGATSSTISITLLAFGVLGVLGNATAGRVGDSVGGVRLVTIALAGLGTAYAALVVTPRFVAAGIVIFAFWAFFSQLYQAPQQSRLVTLLPNQRALILALNAAALYLGMSIGSLLGSSLLAEVGATALPGIGLLLVVAAGLAHTVSRRRTQARAAVPVE